MEQQISRTIVGQDHPTIWKLIETLQVEHQRVVSILLQDERGIRPRKRVNKIPLNFKNV